MLMGFFKNFYSLQLSKGETFIYVNIFILQQWEIKCCKIPLFFDLPLLKYYCILVFASSEPVTGLQQDELMQYFASLRQMLDLFMSWDWSAYFHDYGKETSKYSAVVPENAIVLLEK